MADDSASNNGLPPGWTIERYDEFARGMTLAKIAARNAQIQAEIDSGEVQRQTHTDSSTQGESQLQPATRRCRRDGRDSGFLRLDLQFRFHVFELVLTRAIRALACRLSLVCVHSAAAEGQ